MFTRLLTGPFRLAPSRLGLGRAPLGRCLVRRLAGSSLLEALTAPHGVERYLELVLPGFSLHELRAEVVEVRRRTPGSVTLRLRPNELWRGFHSSRARYYKPEGPRAGDELRWLFPTRERERQRLSAWPLGGGTLADRVRRAGELGAAVRCPGLLLCDREHLLQVVGCENPIVRRGGRFGTV